MVAMLFTVGITLFFVGTGMLAGHIRAHGRSPLMLFFPLASSGYVSYFWSDIWQAAILRTFGLVITLSALALAVAQDPLLLQNPLKILKPDTRGQTLTGSLQPMATHQQHHGESIRWAIRNSSEPKVSGRLMGSSFVYDSARLLHGTLQIQQGAGFYGETEIRLLLGLDASTIERNYSLTVEPGVPGAPEIQVSRYDPRQQSMETRLYHGDYSLELSLGRVGKDAFQGYIQLILPGDEMNYAAGQMVVRTNQLRYLGERVDLTFDHPETLEYVARQYVETQYPESVLSGIAFENTEIRYGEDEGSTVVTLTLLSGRKEERRLLFDRSDIGWAVRPGTMELRVLQEEQEGSPRIVMTGSSRQVVPPSQVPDPITLPFAELVNYNGQRALVHQTDGRVREGVIRGVQRQRLVLESVVQSGLVEFSFAEQDIAHLVLGSGQRLDLEREPSEASAETVPLAVEQEAAESLPAESAVVESDELANYRALIGREVSVSTHDGRSRSGRLARIADRQVVLMVMMDGGSLEYIYDLSEIATLQEK